MCSRTFQMLTVALDKSAVCRTQVQLWYNRFKGGREDVNVNAPHESPITPTTDENIEAMMNMISDNC